MKMDPVVRDLLREISEVWFLTTAWSIKGMYWLGTTSHNYNSRSGGASSTLVWSLPWLPFGNMQEYPDTTTHCALSLRRLPSCRTTTAELGKMGWRAKTEPVQGTWPGECLLVKSPDSGRQNISFGAKSWENNFLINKQIPRDQWSGKIPLRFWIETASNFSAHRFNSSPLQTWGTAQLVLIPEGSQWFWESGKPHLHILM